MLLNIAVLIPALEPGRAFPGFVRALLDSGLAVVVVDDGSGPTYQAIFDEIAEMRGAVLLTHDRNLGKGKALRTGYAYCREQIDLDGVVTADSDGQHTKEDILAIARELANDTSRAVSVVLGVRNFNLDFIPRKSSAGNKLTSRVVQLLFGRYFQDTQTGLRGVSRPVLPLLLSVGGDRFEYEMSSLLRLIHERIEIKELPVETVYHDLDNSQTHFRPVRDSLRIYSVILKQFFLFTVSSLLGSVADILLFTLIINLSFAGTSAAPGVLVATIGARIGSALLNFALNRRAVFHDTSSRQRGIVRYATLALGLVVCSTIGVSILAPLSGGHVVLAKAAVDTVLFVASFLLQKRWVFSEKPAINDLPNSRWTSST